ncbi:hypothetical protein M8J77_011138 [Diaphorina citri]|nr:hypothetical protein M8J77_011138 [Diaphorina citri]
MFRSILNTVQKLIFSIETNKVFQRRPFCVSTVLNSHHDESEEDLINRYKNYLNRECIDHWEIRKAMNDLAQDDGVPDPVIIIAALKAARRLNDYALTIRLLEMVQEKCGKKKKVIWPYILGEIRPTLTELGIETPEDLGYDKPELWCKSTDEFY